jgi:hypothetical protein
MTQAERLSSAFPSAPFERPACPKCKAHMMLISTEPVSLGVDLHSFECAVCNHAFETLATHEDPMKSHGYWLQGDLHPPR